MSKSNSAADLSRRERQIMDVIYRMGKATAVDVTEQIPDPPGNATVRKLLRILEEKGHLRHQRDGSRFVYSPTVSKETARESAMSHMLDTFFRGSAARAVIALLDQTEGEISDSERRQIMDLIERSRKEGR